MNPQLPNNESAPLKLPEVQDDKPKSYLEAPGTLSSDEKSVSQAIERGDLNPAAIQAPPIASPIASDVTAQLPSSVPVNGSVTPKKIQVSTVDLHAADADNIEKIWVDKAKAIVAQTKDDPYAQSNELSKIKEDYQLKRFNTKINADKG